MKKVLIGFSALALAVSSQAISLNELLINAPGGDNGQEFVELLGNANESLAGYSLVSVEGDGSGKGIIDQVVDLSNWSLGANGLFLLRDANTILSPGPDADTSVAVFDFTPDLENGSNTYFLVNGFSGAQSDDLDADDDGVIDATYTGLGTVVDSIGWTDTETGDASYGMVNFAYNGYTPDAAHRLKTGEWMVSDVLATSTTGPYEIDPVQVTFQNGTTMLSDLTGNTLTPGSMNLDVVPEPATMTLLGLGALVAWRKRKSA